MATNRARDAARQLKDDIKNSMRISSRSRERPTPDASSAIISSGRIYFILTTNKITLSSLYTLFFFHRMHIISLI
jgi:hypothetical protein